jgi:hypothetical protein
MSSNKLYSQTSREIPGSSFKLGTSISLASTSITRYYADSIGLLNTEGRIDTFSYLSGEMKRTILLRIRLVVHCILSGRIV